MNDLGGIKCVSMSEWLHAAVSTRATGYWLMYVVTVALCWSTASVGFLFSFRPGSPTIPRASPVSVYLFPGEGSKSGPSTLHVEESELEVAMATEAQAEMMLDDASGDSTDNDDFCILEAPGMGIPVSLAASSLQLHLT